MLNRVRATSYRSPVWGPCFRNPTDRVGGYGSGIVPTASSFNKKALWSLKGKLAGKRVFVCVDFNVSESQIRAVLPTLEFLIHERAIVIIGPHNQGLSLRNTADCLSELLKKEVKFLVGPNPADLTGLALASAIAGMVGGDVALLENLRFYGGEEKGDRSLAEKIRSVTGAEVFVQDGFSVAHCDYASVTGLARAIKQNNGQAVAGFLLQKEVACLGRLLQNPRHPYIAFLGSVKALDKTGTMEKLLEQVDRLVIGGTLLYPFYLADGHQAGKDPLSNTKKKPDELKREVETARDLLKRYRRKIVIPESVVAEKDEVGPLAVFSFQGKEKLKILDNYSIRDVNPFPLETQLIKTILDEIGNPATVIWNGPFGEVEKPSFGYGTYVLFDLFQKFRQRTENLTLIAGGEETARIIGLAKKTQDTLGVVVDFDHVSTGGEAMLEFLAGKELPGIAVLDNR